MTFVSKIKNEMVESETEKIYVKNIICRVFHNLDYNGIDTKILLFSSVKNLL